MGIEKFSLAPPFLLSSLSLCLQLALLLSEEFLLLLELYGRLFDHLRLLLQQLGVRVRARQTNGKRIYNKSVMSCGLGSRFGFLQ